MPKTAFDSLIAMRLERIKALSGAVEQFRHQIEKRFDVKLDVEDLFQDFESPAMHPDSREFRGSLTAIEAKAAGSIYAIEREIKLLKSGDKYDAYRELKIKFNQIGLDCRTVLRRMNPAEVAPSHIVPRQQPGPVRVAVHEYRLAVDNRATSIGVLPSQNVDRIRSSASISLNTAIHQIQESDNTDRRILPILLNLLEHLDVQNSNFSPEALGLNAQIVTRVLEKFRVELPNYALLQIDETLSTIQVVLSQYEEWRLYRIAEEAIKATPKKQNTWQKRLWKLQTI